MENTNRYYEEDGKFIDSIKDQFNLLLVTATKVEKDTLHSYLKPINGQTKLIQIPTGKQTYYLGVFGQYNAVHVSCDTMGAIGAQSSIVTTMDAINYCNPEVVLMMGIAFGVGGKQKIGDVLVSESVMPYEIQRVSKLEVVQRGTPASSCTTLLNRFKHVADWNHQVTKKRKPSIISGQILSGEKLVDNKDFKDSLTTAFPLAKGGEMEGFGLFSACDGRVKHWILVKAICDFADGNKAKRKDHNQKVAAKSAIDLCRHVFNSPYAFQDMKLSPVVSLSIVATSTGIDVAVPPSIAEVESEILSEMKEEIKTKEMDSSAIVQTIVRSFLSLDDEEKISIAKKIDVFDEELNQMYPHIRDKEIFVRLKKKNALSEMWEALHSISPFANSVNPFIKVKI